MSPVLEVALALVLVAINAFFVASEFAIVKIRRTRLEHLARGGDRRARTALGIADRLDAYLSANQLGITLSSLALGWIGEESFSGLLAPGLGTAAAVTVSFVIITFLHTVVGELAPKSLAIQLTEPVALWTAIPLRAFYLFAFPVIWLLNRAATVALRLVGLRPATEIEPVHSPEELRMILAQTSLAPGARRIIDRVFDHTRHRVRHAMTLREDMVTVDAGAGFAAAIRVAVESQFTRFPLVDGDDVVGYVHLKDLFAALAAGGAPDLRTLARQPLVLGEDVALEEARRPLLARGVPLALIRDAGGAVSGLLTLDDVLEDVVGAIRDEHDAAEPLPLAVTERGFEADGRVTLDVVAREVGLHLPASRGLETLGGFVMDRLGRIPEVGDGVTVEGMRLTVVAVRGRRVARVRGERSS